jgi:bifunctional non-homologous end joining protein LigD
VKSGGGLAEYNRKRDFSKTAEPAGERAAGAGHRYLIQKHAATRLHYDFRLELDGVLKSWAVTKGPSLDPADKRLAVHVEDHPLDYGDFEGLIPKGEYGGGTVLLWDTGEWEPLGDGRAMYQKGRLTFLLHGEKLSGKWSLVRMQGRDGKGGKENWLLIKSHDSAAREGDNDKFLTRHHKSVKSGLNMDEIAKGKTGAVWSSRPKQKSAAARVVPGGSSNGRKGASRGRDPIQLDLRSSSARPRRRAKPLKNVPGKRAALPDFVEPQMATRVDRPPEDDGWVHEIKLDGYRAEARLEGGKVQILTRAGLDWTHRFTGIAQAVSSLPAKRAMLDGEIVAVTEAGVPDFAYLQQSLTEKADDRLVYVVFDLIHLDGNDLRELPLTERKALLEKLVGAAAPVIRYSPHFDGSADEVYQQACRLALEGVVSKRSANPYRSGRGTDWLKSKCRERQEFVIGGFTEPTKAGPGIGSLILGQWKQSKLTYAGRVGTGFSNRVSQELRKKLEKLEQASNPFGTAKIKRTGKVHFVKPNLVCEVELASWTRDGLVRQASFLGLREDKPARSVKREVVAPVKQAAAKSRRPSTRGKESSSMAKSRRTPATKTKRSTGVTRAREKKPGSSGARSRSKGSKAAKKSTDTGSTSTRKPGSKTKAASTKSARSKSRAKASSRSDAGGPGRPKASARANSKSDSSLQARSETRTKVSSRSDSSAPAASKTRATVRSKSDSVRAGSRTRAKLHSKSDSRIAAASKNGPKGSQSESGRSPRSKGEVVIEGVRLTHPTRELYPDLGVTKEELARYCVEVADRMLPHVRHRPLSLVRCPDGQSKACFYQKHLMPGMPEALAPIRVKGREGTESYVSVNDVSGLVALVQFGVLEIHPWGAPEDDIERCERLIIDLDPDPSIEWKQVVAAAREVRERLTTLKLESFLKTTGGKGLHVVVR